MTIKKLRYLSVCSGIEAATVAWSPLGWQAQAFAEIEKFPSAVLAYHYPHVPNYGDMTRFQEWPDAAVDVLVGGTPCQSFSVAGLRAGLDDPRGSLMLTYLAIARRYRPRWVVWENVPGVLSSDGGRDFAAFRRGLAELGYLGCYRVLDAQHFGLAQRRKRVFVVAHLGDWRRAAAVLFERASLSGHPAPRREAGQSAPTIPSRSTAGGGLGTDFDCDGGLIPDIADCLTAREHKGPQPESNRGVLIAHSLRADGFDASEDGTGRGIPLIAFSAKDHGGDTGDLAPTLRAGGFTNSHANGGVMPAVAFQTRGSNIDVGHISGTFGSNADRASGSAPMVATAFDARQSDVTHPPITNDTTGSLKVGGGKPGQGYPAVMVGAVALRGRDGGGTAELSAVPSALRASQGGGDKAHVLTAMQVRRLTPRECERLQGFPDDYTLIPYRGKLAADGPRYKALGNSMAVPVMRWIGERIALVEGLTAPSPATSATVAGLL